jgi:GNAT superfamily N-acetyltransferase
VLTAIVLLFLGGVIGGRIAILMSLIKVSEEARHDVTALLDQAADQIATHPPGQWAGWGVHLLKALEDKTDEDAYVAALEAIRKRIDGRLDTGWWTSESG